MKYLWGRVCLVFLLLLLLPGCSQTPQATPTQAAASSGKTVLRIASWLGLGVEELAYAFNEAQDEILLEVITFAPDSTAETNQASKDQAYASFVAGNTPDLYYMISFDENAMREAGLLADWYPIMAADPAFDQADYQTHIWELMEHEGALYTLLASFKLYGFTAPEPLMGNRTGWTLDEFRAWQSETGVTVSLDHMLLAMRLYGVQQDFLDLVNYTCDFECEAFYDWLDFLKSCPPESSGALKSGGFQGFWGYQHFWLMNGYADRYVGVPCATASGPAVSVHEGFALSSTTDNAEACWQFMKWMLSYETQEQLCITGGNGIPVRRDAWEHTLDAALLDADVEGSFFYGQNYAVTVDGEMQIIPRPGLPAEDVAYLKSMVEQVDRTASEYEDITKIMEEEILAYVAGDKSAEECARLIQTRVSTFLAERQE